MRQVALVLVALGLCGCATTHYTNKELGIGRYAVDREWIVTPGPNGAVCDIAYHVLGTYAYCLDYHAPHPASTAVAVKMSPTGTLHICNGAKCLTSGSAPNLNPYCFRQRHPACTTITRRIHVGVFRCKVIGAGVQCITKQTGRGVVIGATGVRRVG